MLEVSLRPPNFLKLKSACLCSFSPHLSTKNVFLGLYNKISFESPDILAILIENTEGLPTTQNRATPVTNFLGIRSWFYWTSTLLCGISF